jgi:hypothetical protein
VEKCTLLVNTHPLNITAGLWSRCPHEVVNFISGSTQFAKLPSCAVSQLLHELAKGHVHEIPDAPAAATAATHAPVLTNQAVAEKLLADYKAQGTR